MNTLSNTRKTAESAIMLALGIALTEISELIPWPFLQGGSVTLFGMVPVMIIAYRHGTKQGLLTGFAFGIIELLFGLKNFSYVKGLAAVILLALLDYLVAFGVMGLAGVFRGRFGDSQRKELVAGGILCCVLRFICHFLSGVVVWGEWTNGAKAVWVYSLTYNGSYMLANTIITVIGLIGFASAFDLRKEKSGI